MKKSKMTSRVYEEAALEAYQKYSNTIFPTEEDFLNHLFFVNGNGYDWIDGALVEEIWYNPSFDQSAKSERVPKITFEEWRAGKADRPIYPICEYAKCMTFDKDIQPDWLAKLKQALDWADNAGHYCQDSNSNKCCEKEDHKWLAKARKMVEELGK